MRKLFIALIIVLLTINTACATTLLTVRGQVRAYLHETDETNSTWTNAQVNAAINQAQDYISNALPYSCHYNLTEVETTNMSVGANNFALPSDFKTMHSVFIAESGLNGTPAIQLNPVNFSLGKRKSTKKDPVYFICDNTVNPAFGSQIYLYPDRATLDGGAILEYVYQKIPEKMTTDTSSVALLPIYDEALVVCASWNLLMLDGQAGRASSVKTYLDTQLASISEKFFNMNTVENPRQKVGQ